MSNLVILIAASLALITAAQSNRLSRRDIDAILNIIQSQQRSESDSESSYEKLALRSNQLVSLLHRSLLDEKKRDKKDRRESKVYRYESNENDEELNRILNQNKDDDDDADSPEEKKKLRPFNLNNLLQKRKDKAQKSYSKNKLVPSNLLESYQDRNDRSLSDYSKIYIILNPDAVKTSQNKKKLANLISRLLSKSSQNEVDPEAYGTRQSNRRDGAEKGGYPMRDSMEEPRPRRPRYNNNYGGGGGAGGRTAIPYIRNRGDIYVRDHDQ